MIFPFLSEDIAPLVTLLVLFQVKHLFADYFLQNEFMLGKFKDFPFYILPLAAHCFVHAIGTSLIVWAYTPHLIGTFVCFDFVSHFVIDRIKASKNLLGRWKPDQAMFWNALGFDQFCHQLVYIFLAILIAGNTQ